VLDNTSKITWWKNIQIKYQKVLHPPSSGHKQMLQEAKKYPIKSEKLKNGDSGLSSLDTIKYKINELNSKHKSAAQPNVQKRSFSKMHAGSRN
jgi:hypothetical protein